MKGERGDGPGTARPRRVLFELGESDPPFVPFKRRSFLGLRASAEAPDASRILRSGFRVELNGSRVDFLDIRVNFLGIRVNFLDMRVKVGASGYRFRPFRYLQECFERHFGPFRSKKRSFEGSKCL